MKRIRRYSIYFGIQRDCNNDAIRPMVANNKLTAMRDHAVTIFGGYTETDTSGGYCHDNGDTVIERGKRFDIFSDDEQRVRAFAAIIRIEFNQESVCFVSADNSVTFITW